MLDVKLPLTCSTSDKNHASYSLKFDEINWCLLFSIESPSLRAMGENIISRYFQLGKNINIGYVKNPAKHDKYHLYLEFGLSTNEKTKFSGYKSPNAKIVYNSDGDNSLEVLSLINKVAN